MAWGYGFRDYVSVGERRARGQLELARMLRAEKRRAAPVVVEGHAIARTFWGQAWCRNLERYGDFASRLPRGRNYARNGSILDLQILPGSVRAYVAGYELYTIEVTIDRLAARRWTGVVSACGSNIGSVIGLLRGELSDGVMAVLTDARRGLFPEPREIRMRCSCPDAAVMCKHVAATLYGVGARLDRQPELFFTLRQVDQADLVADPHPGGALGAAAGGRKPKQTRIATKALESIFGIEIASDGAVDAGTGASRARRRVRTSSRGARRLRTEL